MSDFLAINPAPETVTINGKKIDVHGISMQGFGHLIPRFPNLLNELVARFQKDGNITPMAIMDVAGHATAAILAAGVGHPGDEQAEQMAGQLGATDQLKLLKKIVDRTMPDGVGPFVEQWADLVAKFAPKPLPAPRFKILQRESNPSSGPDIAAKMSGT
jgi:hypothetical protein